LSAREEGAEVLIAERASMPWRGGNSKYTRNLRCVNGDYPADELEADLAGVTGAGSDTHLTRLTIERSAELPEWMTAQGVHWQPAMRGTLQLSRTNRFFLGGGKALVNTYYNTAARRGVRVAYDTAVTGLSFDGGTCGQVVVRRGEATQTLRPRAIVAAAGGFEANLDWLAEHWGEAARNYVVRGARQNDGTVLRCLLDGGAAARGNPRGFHAIAVDARGPRFEGGIVTRVDSVPFSIVVNRDAQRFYDEGEDLWPKRYATWGRLIAEQPGQIAYSIFDQRALERFMPTVFRPYRAETLEGLAVALELPFETLRQTVSDYNAAVRTGTYDTTVLDNCGTEGLAPPKSHWALTLEEPPFYGYPLRPGITFTYLGVGVDDRARVRRDAGGTFDNVFAAGEIMAGNILMRGYLAGFGMTIGSVFGRIAGREAAAHAGAC
jgi:tricarballylate dehydrogenase